MHKDLENDDKELFFINSNDSELIKEECPYKGKKKLYVQQKLTTNKTICHINPQHSMWPYNLTAKLAVNYLFT